MLASLRRVWIELASGVLFAIEFFTNLLRHVGLGRRYYRKTNRVDGHTVLVTGANSGIGLETASRLAQRGAHVILACRNLSSGLKAAATMRAKHSDAKLSVMQLDLSSFQSIHRFADRLAMEHDAIDILVNNAGVMLFQKATSIDGYELQLATNHLGHFLLTKRVLPLLAKSHHPRVVTISSIHHKRGRVFFDDLNFEKTPYDPIEAYCQSKLANVLFSSELARRLAEHPKYWHIHTYCLNPGTINTQLTRHADGVRGIVFHLLGMLFNLDVHAGTQTTLFCCLEPSLSSETGLYYSNCHRDNLLFHESVDKLAANKLWDVSLKITRIHDYLE